MNTQDKKKKFLDDKITEIRETSPKNGLNVVSLYNGLVGATIKVDGLTISEDKAQRAGETRYKIVNATNNGCELTFDKDINLRVKFRIQDVGTWRLFGKNDCCDFVLYFLEQLPSIEKEVTEFVGIFDKKAKIMDITKNSIKAWFDVLCKEIHYPHYTTEYQNKITLSIQMKYNTQIDIPIYYRQIQKFQKTMPKILPTIKHYEKILEEKRTHISRNLFNANGLLIKLKRYEYTR
jgi:hypothetical protein